MNARRRQRGVTLTELLVVGVVLIVLIAVVFAVASHYRAQARRKASASQMWDIHQSMVIHAMSFARRPMGYGHYPGLDRFTANVLRDPIVSPTGAPSIFESRDMGAFPAYRYAVMLNGEYFAPDVGVSPADAAKKTPAGRGRNVTSANFSYAMLRLDSDARRQAWSDLGLSDNVVLSDRNTGTATKPASIWSDGDAGWAGHVIFNDGRAEWIDAAAPIIPNTRYGDGATVAADHLFIPDDTDANGDTDTNAAMVYATDRDHENQK